MRALVFLWNSYLNRLRIRFWAIASSALAGSIAAAASGYVLLGKTAPDFTLRAVHGPNVRLSEHRGDVVVLSFWGSHCGPCGTQLEALDRSFATFKSAGLELYGVNVDDDQGKALEFANARTLGFSLLLDPRKDVARRYRVDNLPMTVLIDRAGTVRYAHRDYNAKGNELYLSELRTLLNE